VHTRSGVTDHADTRSVNRHEARRQQGVGAGSVRSPLVGTQRNEGAAGAGIATPSVHRPAYELHRASWIDNGRLCNLFSASGVCSLRLAIGLCSALCTIACVSFDRHAEVAA
jgi:hypothetical protein